MTLTDQYTRFHVACTACARQAELSPFDVRLLVALHERGGIGTTFQLETEMRAEGSAIRRASLVLRDRKLILADSGEGSTGTKRGVRARLTQTPAGRGVAAMAIELATDILAEVAA